MRPARPIFHALVLASIATAASVSSCSSPGPEGLAVAPPAKVTVKMDFLHRPFPEIAMPTDLATRYDDSSSTKLRLNASKIAPTAMERLIRKDLDTLDGWGTFGPITIPFTGDIDVRSVLEGHRDADYDLSNDVVYVFNVTPSSPRFGEAAYLDIGEGNFPKVVKEMNGYWENDVRRGGTTLLFEETDEDENGDGILQPEEDTDCDAVLDVPNYLPGMSPAKDDLAGRTDALMTFYERQTHTLIAHPLVPLDERTTYAVVVTRRLRDLQGAPVGSPYEFVNHVAQTEKLRPLVDVLPMHGLSLSDVAFTWAYTTGTITAPMVAVRDGLYGHGVQKHLSAEYPPDVLRLERLSDDGPDPYLVSGEKVIEVAKEALVELDDVFLAAGSVTAEKLEESHAFVDYHVMGTFASPQLYPLMGADGRELPLDGQVWPPDVHLNKAPARPEEITFWLTVPRKEVSARGQGKPAPLIVVANGYQSSKFEAFAFAGYFARFGLAIMVIDSVGHGFTMSELEKAVAVGLLGDYGFAPFAEAVFKDRARDQNGDGKSDSGADFFTAYAFHTRDCLRQTVVDYMQMVRMVRAMDGSRPWVFDRPGVAGDFDGDGYLDIGGDAPIHMFGVSMGGIVSTFVGAVEPELTSVATISAGGGLGEGAPRSNQGGIRESFILRLMAPLYVGKPAEGQTGGTAVVTALVPDLSSTYRTRVGQLDDVQPGDTLVLDNLDNGQRGCALVAADGSFRVAVESSLGDRHALQVYDGAVLTAREECELQPGAGQRRKSTLDTFGTSVDFQKRSYAKGEPLRALAEGLGMRRSDPALRRLIGLGQHVLDAADAGVWAQHLAVRPVTHPGTKQTARPRYLQLTTVGDTGVPVAMGAIIGRSAGLIDFLNEDSAQGKTPNQVLLDTHTIEGVNTLRRYTNANGDGVLFDVDNFSEGTDVYVDSPRLDPPLRIVRPMNGGLGASLFLYADSWGTHGGYFPGQQIDEQIDRCKAACTLPGDDDPCACKAQERFDVGMVEVNVISEFLSTGGTRLTFDLCKARNDCDYIAPLSAVGK